ncbi:MAG: aminotransferase class V-fold PLP-dependent enzyme, partial [Acutalibacteraceae bacterium]
MIYFDNAATTFPKPPSVRRAVIRAMEAYGANPGRGGHRMSLQTAREVFLCRQTAAELFGAPDEEHVIFTANATASLNVAIRGLLQDGGRAVVSDLEHNAVMRPLHALSPKRPVYDVAAVTPEDDDATLAAFEAAITPQTKAIVCTHASNVFGITLPVRRIGELARRHAIPLVVDASQSAGLIPIDMERDHIDYLCLPGHKGLYGPMGTGLLICGKGRTLPPLILGGTGTRSRSFDQPDDLPDRLESGTLNVPGICGLRAGMAFVKRQGVEALAGREREGLKAFYEKLLNCKGIRLYSNTARLDRGVPLLSLTVD